MVTDPEARFIGVDSFEGLPEPWNLEAPTGHFATEGEVPHFDDERVRIIQGDFARVLPELELPPHDRLVVNIDCDVYSSAKTALTWLEGKLEPGDYLYFDEFTYRNHELKAFDEFLDATQERFEVAAVTRNYLSWSFRCLA